MPDPLCLYLNLVYCTLLPFPAPPPAESNVVPRSSTASLYVCSRASCIGINIALGGEGRGGGKGKARPTRWNPTYKANVLTGFCNWLYLKAGKYRFPYLERSGKKFPLNIFSFRCLSEFGCLWATFSLVKQALWGCRLTPQCTQKRPF